jgi:aspartyl-tRNA(Asn)/glutamyl-tRNA(Gln) amidotransferase subunit A
MQTIAGKDIYDSTVIQEDAPDYLSGLTGNLKKDLKIGIVSNALHAKGMLPAMKEQLLLALKTLESLGAHIVEVEIPMMEHAAATYFVTSRAEAASNLARFDGIIYGYRAKDAENLQDLYQKSRAEGFGHEVKRRILIGNYVLSAGHAAQYYESACAVRRLIRQEFLDQFKKVDLLFAPVTPAPAFKIGEFAKNPLEMDLQDYFTCSANLAGIPAVSFPCGFVENLPVGFQLMGPDLSEGLIFQTGYAYEQATDWTKHHPSI